MPRVAHLPSSESSSEEEDSSPNQLRHYNHRPVYTTTTARERYTDYLAYTQRSMVNFNEDEVYCLTRIIDGKIRRFKKDSRTWLHKSSSKIKNKKENTGSNHFLNNLPTRCSPLNESKNSADSTKRTENKVHSTMNANAEKEKNHSEKNLEFSTEHYMCENLAAVNSNNGDRHDGHESEEEYMYIGDSDADLTYEEELPANTMNLVEGSVQEKHCLSSSSSSSQQDGTNLGGKEPSNFSLAVSGSLHDQESFEHLDLCNESGNSVTCPGGKTEISRKLAPAIEIEKESYRENLLDYVVNKSVDRIPERSETTTCCETLFRKLRPRTGNKLYSTDNGVQEIVKTRSQRSTTKASTKSSLRRAYKDKNTNGTRKSDTKRIRFAEDEENKSIQEKKSNKTYKKPAKKSKVIEGTSAPSSSRGNDLKSRVPSLFVIAGFVLYGMYESNFERQ